MLVLPGATRCGGTSIFGPSAPRDEEGGHYAGGRYEPRCKRHVESAPSLDEQDDAHQDRNTEDRPQDERDLSLIAQIAAAIQRNHAHAGQEHQHEYVPEQSEVEESRHQDLPLDLFVEHAGSNAVAGKKCVAFRQSDLLRRGGGFHPEAGQQGVSFSVIVAVHRRHASGRAELATETVLEKDV